MEASGSLDSARQPPQWINGATGNVVEGDYIGTDASGTLPLANVVGVALSGLAGDIVGNAFGQTNPGAGNVIAFNSLNVPVRWLPGE